MARMTNLTDVLGLTARSVTTVDLDGRPARRSVLARTYPTTPADLWDALTDPERIPRWFLPVSGDLREGGTYQFEGNAGGRIERCDAPHRLRVTWEMGEQGSSWVTLTLTPDGDATRLELEHLGEVPEEFWSLYGPGATGVGWDLALYGLGLHLASGEALDPAQFQTWTVSPEGTEFVRAVNESWKRASTDAGTPEPDAEAAAARTFAFYTGQPDPTAT
jgi:uncharacterized protein YndB with AHSA1/START domain